MGNKVSYSPKTSPKVSPKPGNKSSSKGDLRNNGCFSKIESPKLSGERQSPYMKAETYKESTPDVIPKKDSKAVKNQDEKDGKSWFGTLTRKRKSSPVIEFDDLPQQPILENKAAKDKGRVANVSRSKPRTKPSKNRVSPPGQIESALPWVTIQVKSDDVNDSGPPSPKILPKIATKPTVAMKPPAKSLKQKTPPSLPGEENHSIPLLNGLPSATNEAIEESVDDSTSNLDDTSVDIDMDQTSVDELEATDSSVSRASSVEISVVEKLKSSTTVEDPCEIRSKFSEVNKANEDEESQLSELRINSMNSEEILDTCAETISEMLVSIEEAIEVTQHLIEESGGNIEGESDESESAILEDMVPESTPETPIKMTISNHDSSESQYSNSESKDSGLDIDTLENTSDDEYRADTETPDEESKDVVCALEVFRDTVDKASSDVTEAEVKAKSTLQSEIERSLSFSLHDMLH